MATFAARLLPIAFLLPLPGGVRGRFFAWLVERCALALTLTLLVANLVHEDVTATNAIVAAELLKGALFGTLAAAFCYAAIGAGRIAIAQLGAQPHAPWTLAYSVFAWLLFALLDGPRHLLVGIARSYVVAPVSAQFAAAPSWQICAELGQSLFAVTIELAAPLCGALLLLDVVAGLVERIAPLLRDMPIQLPLRWLVVATAIFLLPLYGLHVLGPLEPGHPERLWDRAALRLGGAP
jgi:flagellar biosynthesis protein FliR